MTKTTLPPPNKRRIKRRTITPSQPPASSYHPVFSFEPCATPGCFQLHVPQATGSTRCPECLASEVRA